MTQDSKMSPELLQGDPVEMAAAASLRYVNDDEPGYQRKRWGRGFTYFDPEGERVRDPELRARFEALVIPPAWTDVWICTSRRGHIQATGRDEAGRKQYIYHARWAEVRDQVKYYRLLGFGEALPEVRGRVEADLRKRSLSHEKVVAIVVRLLEETLIRVGNTSYANTNDTYGLTTLQNEHLEVKGSQITFHFRGKRGKEHTVSLRDRRLARLAKRCQELPGQHLFQYRTEEGILRAVDSSDVNAYLHDITEVDFTAKDFRTWGGTVAALESLLHCEAHRSDTDRKENVVAAVKCAAEALGNTPAVCRQYYIHPQVVQYYLDNQLDDLHEQAANADDLPEGLAPIECTLVFLLRQSLENDDG